MNVHRIFPALLVGACLVVGAGAASAASPAGPGSQPSVQPQVRQLPDLIIRDIRLNERCQVVVYARNLGPGRVPDSAWTVHTPNSSSVYITIDGRPWGGATIWKFDPARALQSPGGTAAYVSTLVVSGSATILATIDHTAQVTEVNEGNNSSTQALTCGAGPTTGRPQPDLVPLVDEPMNGTVGVQNIGTGPAGPTKLKLECRKEGHSGGGGGCPEIPPAERVRYSDPAFPDNVVVNIPALRPGERHTERLTFWPSLRWTSGRYIFTATADAAGAERESNEGNNARRSTLTVR